MKNDINTAAEKFISEMSKFDKCKVWNDRIYVGKKGRFVIIDEQGTVDVAGMAIHQAQNGAKAVAERAGLTVLENI